jgi:hypothetical protein
MIRVRINRALNLKARKDSAMKRFFILSVLCLHCFVQAATNQFSVTASGSSAYILNGVSNPNLTFVRGFTYTFNISVSGIHPFYIKTAQVTGSGSTYNNGVSAQGVTTGIITFSVPVGAPDTLHYQCGNHFGMHGLLNIVDAPAVFITDFAAGSPLVIASTGSDALNLNVQTRPNLTNAWTDATVLFNNYSDGTNTTQVSTPSGDAAFFQIQQGFF